jgi:outer membrane protein OmpA-like peptidoglycan-associated protein
LSTLSGKVDSQETSLTQVKETANDAVKIARDSRMVSGKIIDSQLLTEDMVLYNYEQPELTAKGKSALDELIKRAVPQLPYIFIEIIGYSDDMSLSSQNRRIALERAESVRRYLFEVGAIPLHRMSVISYGDLKPLTNDGSLEGRSRNRRVTVQVLK